MAQFPIAERQNRRRERREISMNGPKSSTFKRYRFRHDVGLPIFFSFLPAKKGSRPPPCLTMMRLVRPAASAQAVMYFVEIVIPISGELNIFGVILPPRTPARCIESVAPTENIGGGGGYKITSVTHREVLTTKKKLFNCSFFTSLDSPSNRAHTRQDSHTRYTRREEPN